VQEGNKEFDVMRDPDYPEDALNSNIIVEEIEMNGKKQVVHRKTYFMLDGTTKNVTRIQTQD